MADSAGLWLDHHDSIPAPGGRSFILDTNVLLHDADSLYAFDDNNLDGHAWVELDGRVVNDEPNIADHFTVFDEDPTGIVFS